MDITTLGEPLFDSPLNSHVSDKARVLFNVVVDPDQPPSEEFLFELAGPREKIFFDPKKTRAGIVTCGGLCPGLNNVIRSLVLELHHGYGVREILGFVDGYQGLDPWRGSEPIPLTPEFVEDIHKEGGSVLNTSRGPVDVSVAVDNLIRRKVNILFVVGGDGTQRGGAAIYKEASQRGHALAVVGVPKTIDNDVAFVSRTFGYLTAVEEATKVIDCAHTEAHSVHNGISIVKIMGRHAGFIAAGATVASQDVNFTLVPEVPFVLDGEDGSRVLRYHDPRRFGSMHLFSGEDHRQPLLSALGPEPLTDVLTGDWLFERTRRRTGSVKQALMDNALVVGIGNIYANEALFRAGIHPDRAANRISRVRYERLVQEVRAVLTEAIAAGGSTLRDFVDARGHVGYFQLDYFVYGRAGEACRRCGGVLKLTRHGGRATVYCSHCQR